MSVQNRRSFASRVRGFADIMNSAREAAAAVEGGRRPKSDTLRTLGIDPAAFDRIGRI